MTPVEKNRCFPPITKAQIQFRLRSWSRVAALGKRLSKIYLLHLYVLQLALHPTFYPACNDETFQESHSQTIPLANHLALNSK